MPTPKRLPVIVVHGGAWNFPDAADEASRNGCHQAALAGARILNSGGKALDAVEAAVRVLEDDPTFGAGRGSVLTDQGELEMDACIVDGRSLNAGGVASIGNIANPVSLARRVMENTPHVLIVGAGAKAFAAREKVPFVPTEQLVTPDVRKQYDDFRAKYPNAVTEQFNKDQFANSGHDTVGAVAIDENGDVAAATSTGGITNKLQGRVGDSPLVGSGAFADNDRGAVSSTGHGESIIKVCLASRVAEELAKVNLPAHDSDAAAVSVEMAAKNSLQFMLSRVSGRGGVIGVSKEGVPFAAHTTGKMAWAAQRLGVDEKPFGGVVVPPAIFAKDKSEVHVQKSKL